MDPSANGTTRWRRRFLCLLFAFSVLSQFGHLSVAQALDRTVEVTASEDSDPCKLDETSAGQHCIGSSTCPLYVPVLIPAAAFGAPLTNRFPGTDEFPARIGTVPDLKPPKLSLQA